MTFQTLRTAFFVGACAIAFVGCSESNPDSDEDENPSNIDTDQIAADFGDGVIVDCSDPDVTVIDLDDNAGGSLSASDCENVVDGSYMDLYAFEVEDDNTDITVGMSSNDFDTYLYLFDEDGDQIAFNDDGPIDTDAEIEETLDAGVYVIGANSLSAGDTGNYTVRVDAD